MSSRALPMGDRAVLLEYDSLEAALGAYRGLEAARTPGVIDLVPAARTVLVRVDPRVLSPRAAGAWARGVAPLPDAPLPNLPLPDGGADAVVVPVRYDGADLADAAAALDRSPEALVAWHSGLVWTSAFIGFAPGFAYLVAEGHRTEVPRRATSRPVVPAGAVGLAGPFTGVYPRASPGGWRLIGRTDAVLWDAAADRPALLSPGTRVRFEAVP